jgi:hypothetical protein
MISGNTSPMTSPIKKAAAQIDGNGERRQKDTEGKDNPFHTLTLEHRVCL